MTRVREKLPWALVVALGLLLLAALAGVVWGGPLDPPGPPGSTLPQVEPRMPIPPVGWDGTTFPITVDQGGSYFLTGNLTGGRFDGIQVAASDVEIDLNGFTLQGPGTNTGITDAGVAFSNITVRNGGIGGWDTGINLAASANVHISSVTADGNGVAGIETGAGTVEDCVVRGDTGGMVGLRAWGEATISNCRVEGYGTGIALNAGGTVRDSASSGAAFTGIYASGGGTVSGSRVEAVGGSGGPNSGIVVEGQFLVEDNTVTNIAGSPGVDSAIAVSGPSNTVTGNAISFVEYGIKLQDASASRVYENSLSNVTTYLSGSTTDADDIGPERAYDDRGAWDQQLSSVAPDSCNSARFRCVMNDQAVLDRETGLVWMRSPSWADDWWGAVDACRIFDFAGRSGWRLPAVQELAALLDKSRIFPNPSLPLGNPFTLSDADYWSATTNAQDPTLAYFMHPTGFLINGFPLPGWVGTYDKNTTMGVWCVRGPVDGEAGN